MTYSAEYWPIRKQHKQMMSVVEMIMLRKIRRKTRKDRIKNECIQGHLRVSSIGDILRETHLRWFGHVHYGPKMVS